METRLYIYTYLDHFDFSEWLVRPFERVREGEIRTCNFDMI